MAKRARLKLLSLVIVILVNARLELAVAGVTKTWEDVALLHMLQVAAMSVRVVMIQRRAVKSVRLTSVNASSIAPKKTWTSGWFANKSWSPVEHKQASRITITFSE